MNFVLVSIHRFHEMLLLLNLVLAHCLEVWMCSVFFVFGILKNSACLNYRTSIRKSLDIIYTHYKSKFDLHNIRRNWPRKFIHVLQFIYSSTWKTWANFNRKRSKSLYFDAFKTQIHELRGHKIIHIQNQLWWWIYSKIKTRPFR